MFTPNPVAVGIPTGADPILIDTSASITTNNFYPDEMQPRFERAIVLLNLDRDLEAIGDLEHVLEHCPDYPGAATWYAIALHDQGKPMQAAEVKLKYLQSKPPEDWSVNGQAWADCAGYFLKAGTPERALAALDIYFEHYEGKQTGFDMFLGAPYRFRAEALLLLGQRQEALEAVERACADLHSVPANRFLRLRILAALGDRDGAVADLQQLWQEQHGRTSSFAEAVAELKRLGMVTE